jgi:hypothetical protein
MNELVGDYTTGLAPLRRHGKSGSNPVALSLAATRQPLQGNQTRPKYADADR